MLKKKSDLIYFLKICINKFILNFIKAIKNRQEKILCGIIRYPRQQSNPSPFSVLFISFIHLCFFTSHHQSLSKKFSFFFLLPSLSLSLSSLPNQTKPPLLPSFFPSHKKENRNQKPFPRENIYRNLKQTHITHSRSQVV